MSRHAKQRGRREPSGDLFHELFLKGNMLAPFACAAVVKMQGLPGTAMPTWAADYFADLAARYYWEGHNAVREGLCPPSLDSLAGLIGSKVGPWKKPRIKLEALLLKYAFDRAVHAARSARAEWEQMKAEGRPLPKRQGNEQYFHRVNGEPVRVLDKRGRPRREFQIELGRSFGVGGATDDAAYRGVRRRLTKAQKLMRHDDI